MVGLVALDPPYAEIQVQRLKKPLVVSFSVFFLKFPDFRNDRRDTAT
jgi:hypothetical protein